VNTIDVQGEIQMDQGDDESAPDVDPRVLESFPSDDVGTSIPVPISYEIIQLFSEGLYQSPQKAIEELVTNGFDAGAQNVRVVLPSASDKATLATESLFVVDDGTGIDSGGFRDLWSVARSTKKGVDEANGRKPIGQFGIGKLAAFVLAWRLTHVSKSGGAIRAISMNFHRVSDLHQWDPAAPPIELKLHDLNELQAQSILGELETRDPHAWSMLFGQEAADSWTVAVLSDFKNLFDKLSTKRLNWVLRTGLPLVSNFDIFVDGTKLLSSKLDVEPFFTSQVGGGGDTAAEKLGLTVGEDWIEIPGIEGKIRGTARLYLAPLSKSKADAAGRSHGFFVKVRSRIINLDDELFGMSALSHGAWSRFSMEIEVDGLHRHLLSSREGVKDSVPVRLLRDYMHEKFNVCRTRWISEEQSEIKKLSLSTIRGDAGVRQVSTPLIEAVTETVDRATQGSFYLETPHDLDEDGRAAFSANFSREAESQPFRSAVGLGRGNHSPMARYFAEDRSLSWNLDHPLISYVRSQSKNDDPVELLSAAEVLTESMFLSEGINPEIVDYVLRQRDRALRVLVGDKPPVAARILSELDIAPEDKDALERAIGRAFQVLGFDYLPKGGNKGGADGVLSARLGTQIEGLADFKIVYDSKATDSVSVSVGKVDFAALADFARQESTQYGFFAAKKFDGEADELAAINRRKEILNELGKNDFKLILLTVAQVKELVSLHLRFGLTLTLVREMFDNCGSITEVDAWIETLGTRLDATRVPLAHLFDRLEAAKADEGEIVNIKSVRATDETLKQFSSDKLLCQVSAVGALLGENWVSVDPVSMNVEMNSSADQIVSEMYRSLEAEGIPFESPK